MKRFILILISIVTFAAAFAQLNDEQTALRADLLKFLKTEGYAPHIDEDGDIDVKIEGAHFYIRVSDSDTSPMLVTMWRQLSYPEGVNRTIARLAATELNLYKMVKVVPYDSSAMIECQLFLREPEAFKYAFRKMATQIQSAAQDFPSECAKSKRELNNL